METVTTLIRISERYEPCNASWFSAVIGGAPYPEYADQTISFLDVYHTSDRITSTLAFDLKFAPTGHVAWRKKAAKSRLSDLITEGTSEELPVAALEYICDIYHKVGVAIPERLKRADVSNMLPDVIIDAL